MSDSYTPGPWLACHDGECQCGMIWSADGETVVAVAQGPMHLGNGLGDPSCVPNKETQIANAKLMASAPNMLVTITEQEGKIAALYQTIGELRTEANTLLRERDEAEATVIQLRAENDMLFDRAAKRLATIKELQAELANKAQWEPVHMLAQEYPNRKYGIVYMERHDGKRQLRYFIDRGGEEGNETIIELPEDHALCRLTTTEEAGSTIPVPVPMPATNHAEPMPAKRPALQPEPPASHGTIERSEAAKQREQRRWNTLLLDLKRYPPHKREILIFLLEREGTKYSVKQMARALKYTESTILKNPPTDLIRDGLVKRSGLPGDFLYYSTVREKLEEMFGNLDTEALVAELIKKIKP